MKRTFIEAHLIGDLQKAVWSIIREHKSFQTSFIAEELKIKDKSPISSILTMLCGLGAISKIKRGVYIVSDSVTDE